MQKPVRYRRALRSGIWLLGLLLFAGRIPADTVPEIWSITGRDIYPIVAHLNQQIRNGGLPAVHSGWNMLRIPVSGRPEPVQIRLYIPVIRLDLPGIHAEMRLQGLRFRHATLRFDESRQALHLRSYFQDRRNGVGGHYTVGPVGRSLRLHSRQVRSDAYLKPRVEDGLLGFEPLVVQLSFYEGHIPRIVRPFLLRRVEDAVQESERALQAQFDAYAPELFSVIRSYLPPEGMLTRCKVTDGTLNLYVSRRRDH